MNTTMNYQTGKERAALTTAVGSNCAGGRWRTADGGWQMMDSGERTGDHVGRRTMDGGHLFPVGAHGSLEAFPPGGRQREQ